MVKEKKNNNFAMPNKYGTKLAITKHKAFVKHGRNKHEPKARTHNPAHHKNENMRENRSNMHGHAIKQNKKKCVAQLFGTEMSSASEQTYIVHVKVHISLTSQRKNKQYVH